MSRSPVSQGHMVAVNSTLVKALIALLPICILLAASGVMFAKQRRLWSVLQLLGAAGMMLIVLAQLCEALQILPWMRWGQEHSTGHYVDLLVGIVGITFFPLGFLLHALTIGTKRTDN